MWRGRSKSRWQRFKHRRAAVVTSLGEAAVMLGTAGTEATALRTGSDTMQDRGVAFVCCDGGAPVPGMLAELASREPFMAKALGSIRDAASELADADVVGLLTQRAPADDASVLAQPVARDVAAFLAQWATAALLRSWAIQPVAVLGTGLGEIVAACIAGVLTPEHGLAAVATRAELLASCEPGDQAALSLAGAALAEWLMTNVTLAPAELTLLAAGTTIASGQELAEPSYWRASLTGGHQLADPMKAACAETDVAFLAFGPGEVNDVRTAAAQHCQGSTVVSAVLPPGDDPSGEHLADDIVIANAIADLWVAGAAIDWTSIARDIARGKPWQPRRVALPTYPFERADHWLASAAPPPEAPQADGGQAAEVAPAADGELPRLPVSEWIHLPLWQQNALPKRVPAAADWLVFTDDSVDAEFSAELLSCLSAGTVTLVRPGPAVTAGPDGYTIRPGEQADLAELIEASGAWPGGHSGAAPVELRRPGGRS